MARARLELALLVERSTTATRAASHERLAGWMLVACVASAATACASSATGTGVTEPRPVSPTVARDSSRRTESFRGSPVRFESPPGRPLADRTRYRFVGAHPEEQIVVECRVASSELEPDLAARRARIESAGGRIEETEPLRVGAARVPHLSFVIEEGRADRVARTRIHWAFPAANELPCRPFVSVSASADRPDDSAVLLGVVASVSAIGTPPPSPTARGWSRWQAGPIELDVPPAYQLAETRRYVYESEDGRLVLAVALGSAGRDGEDFGVSLDEAEVVARRQVLVDARATFEVDYRVAGDEGSEPVVVRVAEIDLGGSLRLVVWARAPTSEADELERIWTQLLASLDLGAPS